MNKPPERIRVEFAEDGFPLLIDTPIGGFSNNYRIALRATEHFYVLEKEQKPMEKNNEEVKKAIDSLKRELGDEWAGNKRTENLTTEEAWAAMARGECVSTSLCVHRINGLFLEWYDNNGDGSKWESASNLEPGPYSIVPDPSKPKEVEDEYEAEKERLLDDFNNTNSFKMATKSLIEFMERNFARKP